MYKLQWRSHVNKPYRIQFIYGNHNDDHKKIKYGGDRLYMEITIKFKLINHGGDRTYMEIKMKITCG